MVSYNEILSDVAYNSDTPMHLTLTIQYMLVPTTTSVNYNANKLAASTTSINLPQKQYNRMKPFTSTLKMNK